MPDMDNTRETKEFYLKTPPRKEAFFLKGSGALDWGMQDRLARIFQPQSGRTVMLAIDHGYFQGPTSGLERGGVNLVPLVPSTDPLMPTRAIFPSTTPAASGKPIALPASRRPSIPKEPSNQK